MCWDLASLNLESESPSGGPDSLFTFTVVGPVRAPTCPVLTGPRRVSVWVPSDTLDLPIVFL